MADPKIVEEVRFLEEYAQSPLDLDFVPIHVEPEESNLPSVSANDVQERVNKGRLSGSIGPDKSERLSVLDRKGDLQVESLISLPQLVDLKRLHWTLTGTITMIMRALSSRTKRRPESTE
jgi:hypothetical protein